MDKIVINDGETKKLLEKASKITDTDYSECTLECLYVALEDMIIEYKHKQEELDDLKQEIEDRYRPLTTAEYLGNAYYVR